MPHRSADMRLLIAEDGVGVVIGADGELDIATTPALRRDLAIVIDAGQGDVLVDMSTVTFCDSTVLGTLVAARLELAATGRRMRIVQPSRSVRRLLRIAELSQLLT